VFFLGARFVRFDWVFIDTHLRSDRLKTRLCFSVLIGLWLACAGEFFLSGSALVGYGLYFPVLAGEDCGYESCLLLGGFPETACVSHAPAPATIFLTPVAWWFSCHFVYYWSLFTVYHCNDQILLEHLDGLGTRLTLISLDMMCFIVKRGSNGCSSNVCLLFW
jgi:hypothetical protein